MHLPRLTRSDGYLGSIEPAVLSLRRGSIAEPVDLDQECRLGRVDRLMMALIATDRAPSRRFRAIVEKRAVAIGLRVISRVGGSLCERNLWGSGLGSWQRGQLGLEKRR